MLNLRSARHAEEAGEGTIPMASEGIGSACTDGPNPICRFGHLSIDLVYPKIEFTTPPSY